jgi:hypothetical protein
MQTAIESVVRFDDEAVSDLALEADVRLIALRNAKTRIEATREVAPLRTSWQRLPRSS